MYRTQVIIFLNITYHYDNPHSHYDYLMIIILIIMIEMNGIRKNILYLNNFL